MAVFVVAEGVGPCSAVPAHLSQVQLHTKGALFGQGVMIEGFVYLKHLRRRQRGRERVQELRASGVGSNSDTRSAHNVVLRTPLASSGHSHPGRVHIFLFSHMKLGRLAELAASHGIAWSS